MLASYMKSRPAAFLLTIFLALGVGAHAQSGSSTSITGTVVDPSGAVVPNATLEVRNPVSGFSRNAVNRQCRWEIHSSPTCHSILIT